MSESRTQKLSGRNLWNELIALRDEQREALKTAVQVVRGAELPQENNPMGLMRWYLHPSITDTVLSTQTFFEQEIPPGSRSGRLKFQGGQVILVLEGRGYTLIDGVKYPWEAGDAINLPLKPNGIIVQHVNTDPNIPVKLLGSEANFFHCTTVDRGSGFELLEPSPDYKSGSK